jgi:threonine efflux protein
MLGSLVTIALLHWAVLLVPGFNVVLIGQLAAGGTRSTAMLAVLGMTTATLIWASLAVLGVGAVFSAHPQLRFAAQIAGGAYLLYLAVKLWRSGGTTTAQVPAALGGAAAFRIGLVTSLLNPKIALFYGSVFATALPPSPTAVHLAAALGLVCFNSLVWHGFLGWGLSRSVVRRFYGRYEGWANRVSAVLVGAFGAWLIQDTVREALHAMIKEAP